MFTWVYRKKSAPFNTNIINVGLEGGFYSLEGDSEVDDAITLQESGYSGLIQALREGREESLSEPHTIADLLAHLEVRSRHLRQNFLRTADHLATELLRFLEDGEAFGSYIKRKILNDHTMLKGVIEEELKQRGIELTAAQIDEIVRASRPMLEANLPAMDDLASIVNHFKSSIPKIISSASKTGHINALRKTLSPPVKKDVYSSLKFHVIHSPDCEIPLGDSMLIFQLEGERKFKPFFEIDDRMEAIYLPLSSDRVLVGRTNDAAIDLSDLPLAIAKCSLEYFISGKKSAGNDILRDHIGDCAHMLSHEQIAALIEEIKET